MSSLPAKRRMTRSVTAANPEAAPTANDPEERSKPATPPTERDEETKQH